MTRIFGTLADLKEESIKLERAATHPEGTVFTSMFSESGTSEFMIRGGEYPPTVWDHECLRDAMEKALTEGKKVHFISGPQLCIGSCSSDTGEFQVSKFLMEFVLPNLRKGDAVTFYVEKSDLQRPDIKKSRKSKGYLEHRDQVHYRSSEKRIVTHIHMKHRRFFRHFEKGEDFGNIEEIRGLFAEVRRNPEENGYQTLQSFLAGEKEKDNERSLFILQRIDDNNRNGYYEFPKEEHIEGFVNAFT